jgi:hypothetical protein
MLQIFCVWCVTSSSRIVVLVILVLNLPKFVLVGGHSVSFVSDDLKDCYW